MAKYKSNIIFRIEKQKKQMFYQAARRNGVVPSKVIRIAIDSYIQQQAATKRKTA